MLIPKNICFRKFINWERKGNFKNKAIQMKKNKNKNPIRHHAHSKTLQASHLVSFSLCWQSKLSVQSYMQYNTCLFNLKPD